MNHLFNGPKDPKVILILAHGSGAGMDTEFMTNIAEGISESDISVMRFEFPYMAKTRKTGKRSPPNSARVLIETYRKIISTIADGIPVFIGGKSMGGRIASMIADSEEVHGCICLGYPFHPPGKPTQLRTAHLEHINTPICIVQGTRDPFGTKAQVSEYSLSANINITWLENGDHSFKTRKKDRQTHTDLIKKSINVCQTFIHNTLNNSVPLLD